MWRSCLVVLALSGLSTGYSAHNVENSYDLADAFLREMVAKMGKSYVEGGDYMDLPAERPQQLPLNLIDSFPSRVAKMYEAETDPGNYMDYDTLAHSPSIRDQEYLQHSSLWGNQYIAGGAGEGTQRLKPDGAIKNTQQVKTDGVLPAYCNPPNPCPLGYTGEEECLHEFENSASFSRNYQAAQQCMCDAEHMFNCPDSTQETEISALARSIQNEGLMGSTLDKLIRGMDMNPYLEGDKLPVAAKKGMAM